MKTFFVIFTLALLGLVAARAPGNRFDNNVEKCEDILAEKICKELRDTAERLKLKVKEIDTLVKQAVEKQITEAKAIIKHVREQLADLAKNFKCEDVLGSLVCDQLKALAARVKIKAEEVDKQIRKFVAEGITKAKEILEKLKEKLFPAYELEVLLELDALKCEDILSADKCAALKEAAQKLKQKVEVIDRLVRETVAKGITEAKEIVEKVRTKLVDLAKNIKCEDILAEKICAEIRAIAVKVEAKVEEVEKKIKEAIAHDIAVVKEIIEWIKQRLHPQANQYKVEKCEDVLAEKICKELRDAAEHLKLKAKEIDALVRQAVEKEITDAKAIVKHVREQLVDLAKNFKCEDVLGAAVCGKLRELAEKLQVKAEAVETALKKLVAKGITKATEIIEKIKRKLFPALEFENAVEKCEDVLAEKICKELRDAAEHLKLKAKEIDALVRQAVEKEITDAKAIVKHVREQLVDLAKNFKCEDVLGAAVCGKLRELAEKLQVKAEAVETALKKLVAKGITKATEIIEKIKRKLFPALEFENAVEKCEDVLAEKICKELRDAAEHLKLKAKEIDTLVRQAVEKEITDAKAIVKHVREQLVDLAKNFKCEDVLGAAVCVKLRELAEKLQVKAEAVETALKKLVAKGITKATEIIEKIKRKLFPALEFENAVEKCEDVLAEKICKELRDAAEHLKLKAKEIDALVRQAVEKEITDAKAIVKHVREQLVDLAKNFKCEDVLGAAVCVKLRELAEKLQVKAEAVETALKKLVAKGITKATEIIEKIKRKLFPALEFENAVEKCEDVLAEKICKELRDAAEHLKLKAKEIDTLVRQAVEKEITDAKAIVKHVREQLVDLAKNFKCEDVLGAAVCVKLRELAEKLQVKAEAVETALKKLVAKGITKATEIIEKIKRKLFPALEFENAVEKCEDVLAEKICKELRDAAEHLKLKAKEIDALVRQAVEKEITDAKAIVKHVREQLVDLAKNFKCEDVLGAAVCVKLRELAEKLQVKAEAVETALKKLVAKGITKATEIIEKIKRKLFPAMEFEDVMELEMNALTCEAVLGEKACAKLREMAKKLKEKVDVIDKLVREAVEAKVTQVEAIAKQVREKLLAMAKNLKCESVLGERICAQLRETAKKLKEKAGIIDQLVREAVKAKITEIKDIVKHIKLKLLDMAKNLKCEDVLGEKICTQLRDAAKKLKEKATVIDQLVREAIKAKITEAKALIKEIREKLVAKAKDFKCEDVLTADMCKTLRELAETIKVLPSKVDKALKALVAKGISKAKELIEKLRQKLFPAMDGEVLYAMVESDALKCEDVLGEKACAKLRETAQKLKEKVETIDKLVREAVEKKITEAKAIIKDVREKLLAKAKNLKCEDVLGGKICTQLRDAAKKLKEKATVIDQLVREAVKAKITEAKALIKEIREKLVAKAKDFKCEDVLTADMCKTLRELAETIKVLPSKVDKALKALVAKGISKAKELIKKLRQKLFPAMDREVLYAMVESDTLKCEDVLGEKACAKLRETAQKLKEKVETIDKLVREAVEKKITKAKAIIKDVREKLLAKAKNLKCEDVLGEKICTQLRDAAKKLKEKATVIDQLVREAVKAKITEAKALIKEIREKLVAKAKDFKCEDVLTADMCKTLRELAETIKVLPSKVDKALKALVAKGISKAKELLEKLRQKLFPANIDVQKCEDVLAEKVCKELRDTAGRLKLKASEIDALVRHVVAEKITDAKAMIAHIRKDLAEKAEKAKNLKCEDVLPEMACTEMRRLAEKVKVGAAKVDETIRELVASGIVRVHEILEKIKEKLFPAEEFIY